MIGGKWRAIDKDIAPIVAALNQVGCTTVASCSGHGHRPGNIALADGREIVIARNFEEGRRIDRLFPIGANGEPAPKADSALVGELRDSPEYTLVLNVDTGEKGDSHVRISTDLRDRILAALSDRDVVLEEAALHPVLVEIMAEVEKATRKFPTWPTRIIDAGNVVSEEAGELAKACLQVTYEPHKETLEGVRMEAIQTAAMAFRFLCSMDRYNCEPGPQHEQDPLSALKGGVDE